MDALLKSRLAAWEEQIHKINASEVTFLGLEAVDKSLHAHLFLEAKGGTVAEREAKAYDNEEWRTFAKGLAEAKAVFNHDRRLLELRQKELEAEYLHLKQSHDFIKRN